MYCQILLAHRLPLKLFFHNCFTTQYKTIHSLEHLKFCGTHKAIFSSICPVMSAFHFEEEERHLILLMFQCETVFGIKVSFILESGAYCTIIMS